MKFAKLGSRMAELLPLEHLALRALADAGVPAAATQLLAAGGHVFLEVVRFDRVGLTGRIGNTDRHFENISLLIDEDGEYQRVAPAYDILPMRYAPIGGGVDPALTPIEPRIGTIGPRQQTWERAARAAERI